jgi:hypothetical protein
MFAPVFALFNGQRSVRGYTVYADDVFMIELGTQFDEMKGATLRWFP